MKIFSTTLTLLILSLSTSASLAQEKPQAAVPLEDKQIFNVDAPFQNVVVSDDQQLIADYTYFEAESEALFRLWNKTTGELLKSKRISNYEERSLQTSLHFSPENRFVYLKGMSEDTSPIDPQFSPLAGDVPFWNLASNELVMSPCQTGMGITDVAFSHDQKVAYTKTVDSYSSLCSTHERKLFAFSPELAADPQAIELFKSFATKDYEYFHNLDQHFDLSTLHADVFFYKPTP